MWSNNVLAQVLILVVCIGMTGPAMAHFSKGSVGTVGDGTVMYSADDNEAGAWTTTLTVSSPSVSWYSRLEIAAGGYSGPVTITWQLQQKTGASTWTGVTERSILTSTILSGSAQNIYATSDGVYAAGNHDWGIDATAAGTYRIVVAVESAY